jgi:hypothetical protein
MVIERYDKDIEDEELPTLSVGGLPIYLYRGHVHLRYHGYRYIHIR